MKYNRIKYSGLPVTTSFHLSFDLMNRPAPQADRPLVPRIGRTKQRPVPRQYLRIKSSRSPMSDRDAIYDTTIRLQSTRHGAFTGLLWASLELGAS